MWFNNIYFVPPTFSGINAEAPFSFPKAFGISGDKSFSNTKSFTISGASK